MEPVLLVLQNASRSNLNVVLFHSNLDQAIHTVANFYLKKISRNPKNCV